MIKRIKDILFWGIIAIVVVLLLLFMVWIFEQKGIHVPGSRDMWIGLIGAVIGGAFTMLGVRETIYEQEESDSETKRLENMPILGFQVVYDGKEADSTLSCWQGELLTSGFNFFLNKEFCTIYIQIVNEACAFDFTIEGCAINGKELLKNAAFAPASRRIAINEKVSFGFEIMNTNTNAFCVVRFSYKDIFGNKYFQELPFTYYEAGSDDEARLPKQIIEIRDIKPPVLVKKDVKMLQETAKEYEDYETFWEKPVPGLDK